DGSRLVSAGRDDIIKNWDARPWTPDLRRQRAAPSLVEYLCRKAPSKEKESELILADKGITEDVRGVALSLVDAHLPRRTEQVLRDRQVLLRDRAARIDARIDARNEEWVDRNARLKERLRKLSPGDKEKGFLRDWLILAPISLPPGQTGAEAVELQQIEHEA